MLITKPVALTAQTYQYANFSGGTVGTPPASSITGSGSFTNPSMVPNFTFAITSSPAKINRVSYTLSSDDMPETNPWETKYGEVTLSTSLLRVAHSTPSNMVGDPVGSPITTKITFNSATPPDFWGFMVLDIDVDQVTIRAKDASGNYYSNAEVSSWFKGVFDASTGSGASSVAGAVEPPCWDAANATVVGSEHVSNPCLRKTTLDSKSDYSGAAAYFEPDVPVSELEFINENLQTAIGPSQRYLIAAAQKINITGTVWNDADGSLSLNGAETVTNAGGPLFVNLVDAIGAVIASSPVAADGTYSLPGPLNTFGLKLVLASTATATTPGPLPTNWVNTGENVGSTNTATQSATLGQIELTTGLVDIVAQNYGIEQRPNSTPYITTIPQPTSGQTATLNGGSNPPFLTGSDPEDQPVDGTLSGKSVAITSPITNGELRYNDVLISVGHDGVNPPSAGNPFVIPNFNPNLLTVVLTGSGYTSTQFNYAYIDAAGMADPTPATYQLNWSNALPVTLLNFTARREEGVAMLNWATTSEVKSDYFAIEHSTNGKNWQKVGEVKAGGDSWKTIYYSFRDNTPTTSENLYRLKMVDKDGTFAYSKIVSVVFQIADQTTIFPNPVSDKLTINLRDWSKVQRVNLYDTKGKTVYTSHRERTDKQLSSEINVKGFESGIYIVRITLENGTVSTHKIVVSK